MWGCVLWMLHHSAQAQNWRRISYRYAVIFWICRGLQRAIHVARFPIASFSGFGEIRAAFQPFVMDHGAAECICGHLFIGLLVAVGHANDIAIGGYIGNIFNGKRSDSAIINYSDATCRFHWP